MIAHAGALLRGNINEIVSPSTNHTNYTNHTYYTNHTPSSPPMSSTANEGDDELSNSLQVSEGAYYDCSDFIDLHEAGRLCSNHIRSNKTCNTAALTYLLF